MASLATKDSYLQSLAKKICVQQVQEPRKRTFASKQAGSGDAGSQPKEKKRKKPRKQAEKADAPPAKEAAPNTSTSAPAKKAVPNLNTSTPAEQRAPNGSRAAPTGTAMSKSENGTTGRKSDPGSFSAVNILRQRLHEKMQEVSGQGGTKELSPAVLEKRRRRKYEKERKRRREKELKMKEKMEKKGAQEAAAAVEPQQAEEESKVGIIFNQIKVCEEEELSKTEKKREKRKRVKGNLTPLTGKNYKQLLSRLEARKSKLEELKDKDQKKAQELENKMKWTNVLYKAEGVKIRDDEERLKAALKRKEKHKAQRQKQWEKRTEHVVEKMQQRQDKRRKNIQKKKMAKVERRKDKARKKGRILPEDLEKAGVK
ncbi:surfeit locus protein 6 [Gopherus evgoodei]|uniref:Surfeit 6 n=1 Tax=Gopherus evgoodei TaxID=1825980 RepID=A0A8C4W3D9_9SAUR|nr:surfeit locus protein 6 [Gopherus evgoodei]XP_030391265.1 surfeit locus protein 6 [Gopherus evgoodei]